MTETDDRDHRGHRGRSPTPRGSRRATARRSSPRCRAEFEIANVMQVPGLTKIVVNMGVGEAARDSKLIEGAVKDLTAITGQKPQVTKARKSIAQFKLREGMPIGAHVTLRGDRMWEFLDRLLSLALPRIRDFRGLSPQQFDGRGNYTFGLTEQVMFHEIDQDRIDRVARHGHHGRHHRHQRRRGSRAAQAARLPVQGELTWRRLLSRSRPPASRSSRCAATPAASAAAGPRPSTASSACAGSACGRWRTAASCPASPSPPGNHLTTERSLQVAPRRCRRETTARKSHTAMTMTDPIADMLTRLRNANQAYHDAVSMPYSKLKAGVAEILKQEGYITSYDVEEPAEGEVGKTLTITLKYGRNRERSIAGVRRISKPGLRVYAKRTGLPEGARRPGRRDHLDQPGPADRPPGQPEGRGWGSPRLRLVTTRPRRRQQHVAHWQAPHRGPVRCRRRDRRASW